MPLEGLGISFSTPYSPPPSSHLFSSGLQAYPVMGVIAFAVVFSLGYGLQVMVRHPDARIGKGSRKSLFRGELKGTPL